MWKNLTNNPWVEYQLPQTLLSFQEMMFEVAHKYRLWEYLVDIGCCPDKVDRYIPLIVVVHVAITVLSIDFDCRVDFD